MFPSGVSRHGDFYFLNADTKGMLISPNIELLFEYVRRSSFKALPSRFQCWFGCETAAGLEQFAAAFRPGGGIIWEVTAADSFRADMSLLQLSGSLLQLSYAAHHYWRGHGGANPFWEILLVPPIHIVRKVKEIPPKPGP